ncbi:rhomboid family intramembrane serine protease [Mucilaginibacter corticis]|uniref:Rhomboid family intramembrane serine protease n=1 Tax=Mucilaginibacter corticis TaxID=2597670 RepID=A0A556MTH4_9SPHI|nr:rhomboid family intramembrane serine protease [Mucilaginibacter corticis]TSJ43177.1 rhomboid family intramembrane serine protease [Mucilaginibacter corticis]
MTFWENLNFKVFRSGSKLYLLIGINVIVFFTIGILSVFEKLVFRTTIVDFYSQEYLTLQAYLPKLAVRFWTLFTYMFMHADIWHLLFNMLWFYWMGQIFEEFLGNKRILGLYLLGGLSGAVLYVVSFNIFPLFSRDQALLLIPTLGSSASVMAVIAGAATITPNYTIMLFGVIPIKLKWIAIFYVAMGFWGITGPNAGGEIAHIGGALFGFIYVKQLQNGRDMIGTIAGIFKSRSKLKVASTNRDRPASDAPRQEEVDRILDKISTTGYDNLSKQEKETLFRASKK